MLLPAVTLLALFAGVHSQERLFLNNPLVTVTRTTTTTTTSTLIPTCFEVVKTTACARKKKQLAFLVNPFDYYHGVVPQQVIAIQPTPEYRFLPFQPSYFNPFAQQPAAKPAIESSFDEKAEGQARFFGTSLIKFTTSTSTSVVPVVATNTQTLQINCLATGQSVPSNVCTIRITFPPVPAGTTLSSYCQSLADVAKMALAECKFATSRKRRQASDNRNVIVGFGQKPGGDPPSRQIISQNIVGACGNKQKCTLPGIGQIDLGQVQVPGFTTILEAGGSSSKFSSAK